MAATFETIDGNDYQSLNGMTYLVKTFGCQMNKHDSERVSGLLDAIGMEPVETVEEADVVVYMTCCVREAADERLFGQVASMKNIPPHLDKRIVAIGGCVGQRDGESLKQRLGNVNVVFGTHNIAHLPALLMQALENSGSGVEVLESAEGFTTDLPSSREHTWHAWVPITAGCNNFCTYCIVPYVRGREKSRPMEDILQEIDLLAADGVHEITLLGQNVNSYGRDLYGKPCFADLLRQAGSAGIPRVRFATSHPKDLSDDTIAAMAQTDAIMPYLHLPVQSGSDRILKAMNRRYTAASYLERIDRLRVAIPDIALSTDIIVGFPGETEQDFLDTLRLVERVGYHQAFTFIYSKRAGTPAAEMPQNASREEIQDRFDRLVASVQSGAYAANQADLGKTVEVLVEGTSKSDAQMLSGRSPKNQVVHAPLPQGTDIHTLIGGFTNVHVDTARTWYLSGEIADGD